jgi:serine/threonine protein kinase/Tol biopolymer transport system component
MQSNSLGPGTRLGPYEVVSQIGAGGMGEVFRAHDPRLNRDVAIKLLPIAFARDEERVARFRREAQLVAALNHPNIAAIHGLEENGDVLALALELVEGEDLAQRLRRGPIPVEEARAIARQIAEGLEAAHEKGIVHRDLKPGNIKLKTDGTVKILDFGLARSPDQDTAATEESLAHSPTMARGLTEAGVILGTAAYMSPEQARGKPVDKRSDIWSFGVVLYEMLTGTQSFRSETVSDTLAAVLRQEIDFGALPAETPPAVRWILERCLQRDPKKRLRDIGEARVALERMAVEAGSPVAPVRRASPLPWALAIVLALAVAALAWMQFGRARVPQRTTRLTFEPPAGVAFDSGQNDFITISPDGRTLAFTGRTADGKRQLWVRPLDSLDARPLPDSDDALEPFWSPDSKSIAFGSQGKLKRVDLAGGRAVTLADAARLVGGSWSGDGVILFAPDWNAVLHRVDASGGTARPVGQLDPAVNETAHSLPSFLEDGTHYVHVSLRNGTPHIVMASLDSPERKVLLPGVRAARYSRSGWMFFARDGEQWAQPFDARALEFAGEPVKLSLSTTETGAASEIASPVASDDGVVVWRRIYRPDYQLVWFDRTGTRMGSVGPPIRTALTMAPRLSPDETRVAIQNRDSDTDRIGIWVYDLRTGVPTRLSSVLSQFPQWSPDGTKVAWVFQKQGVVGIYQRSADGSGDDELVLRSGDQRTTFPADWSVDGRFLLYWSRGSKTRVDTWILPLTGERKPIPLLASEYEETGSQLSPDSRWVAYRSDVSGTNEIYLQSVNGNGTPGPHKIRVTSNGGAQPRFRGDGRELFYLANDGQMMAVSLEREGETLRTSTPKALFQTRILPAGAAASFEYDVTSDGERFLIGTILDGPNARPPSPVIITGWQGGR